MPEPARLGLQETVSTHGFGLASAGCCFKGCLACNSTQTRVTYSLIDCGVAKLQQCPSVGRPQADLCALPQTAAPRVLVCLSSFRIRKRSLLVSACSAWQWHQALQTSAAWLAPGEGGGVRDGCVSPVRHNTAMHSNRDWLTRG